MRASLFSLVLFTAATTAAILPKTRDLHDYPDCAVKCLHESDHKGCARHDLDCLCNNSWYNEAIEGCFEHSCPRDDVQKADWAHDRACQPFHHDGGGNHGGDDHGGDHGGDDHGHGGDDHGGDDHGHNGGDDHGHGGDDHGGDDHGHGGDDHGGNDHGHGGDDHGHGGDDHGHAGDGHGNGH